MKIIKSWPTHNLIGHPLSEILYLAGVGLQSLGHLVHDKTVPNHEPGTGRG